jgi:hypothetical protein
MSEKTNSQRGGAEFKTEKGRRGIGRRTLILGGATGLAGAAAATVVAATPAEAGP